MDPGSSIGAAKRPKVTVDAPARLHLGFLDMHGGLGRRYGGLGLAVGSLRIRLEVTPAAGFEAIGPDAAPALDYARRLGKAAGLTGGLRIRIYETIPRHAGLGSGTQLALAVGTAMARLYGLEQDTATLGEMLARGARSGIGVGAFEQGGFLLDSGRKRGGQLPPVTARLDFPAAWRLLLLFDEAAQGLHGAPEIAAFRELPAFTAEQAGQLCRLALMRVLPSIVEADLELFSQGISEVQREVGDYFAAAQGGRFTSPRITRVLSFIESQGITGIGQSSWGPTGFAVVGSESQAYDLMQSVQTWLGAASHISLRIVEARNHGGVVESSGPVPAVASISDASAST